MGDHREQVVDVSTRSANVGRRTDEVRTWLRRTGWATPDDGLEDWLHEGSTTDALSRAASEPMAGGTVTVVGDERTWTAGDGTRPARCRSCATFLGDEYWEQVGRWIEEAEPTLSCPACGWSALAGDWDVSGSVVVGCPAVVLDVPADALDPGGVAAALRMDLVAELGGRWAVVHRHA